MDEDGLKNLLELGFTYEDLYKRGLLILKPAQTAPQTAENAQTSPHTAENAQTTETMSPEMVKMWKAFDFFKDEIKRMIQGVNTQNATRTEDAQQMTVAAAIQGLYKGDKT